MTTDAALARLCRADPARFVLRPDVEASTEAASVTWLGTTTLTEPEFWAEIVGRLIAQPDVVELPLGPYLGASS